MDDPTVDPTAHAVALDGLARLNRVGGLVEALLPPIMALARRRRCTDLTLLDVAAGGGDVPIVLAGAAARHGLRLRLTLVDRSETALACAQSRAGAAGVAIACQRVDALEQDLPGEHDLVLCSHFLHHLRDDQASDLLRRLARHTRHLLLVADLVRSHWTLALVWSATRMLTSSAMLRTDGPRSVRAAFTRAEVAHLSRRAGLIGAAIHRFPPCHLLLEWKSGSAGRPRTARVGQCCSR